MKEYLLPNERDSLYTSQKDSIRFWKILKDSENVLFLHGVLQIDTINNCVIVWLNHKDYSILYLKGDWESKMSDLNHEMNSSGSKCLATMFEWIAHYCKRSGSILFSKGIQKAYFPFWRCSRSTHNNNIVVVNHCEV